MTTVTGRARARRVAGAVFTVTGIATFMGIITGEALYPRRFTTAQNTISDLGGTRPPHSVVFADSRALFVVLTIGAGLLLLVGAAHLALAVGHRTVVAALAVAAIGLVGMGIFPGDVLLWHHLFALTAFVAGALAAISAREVVRGPYRWFGVVLGAVSLVAMVLGTDVFATLGPVSVLGVGGVERWAVYPVLLWLVGFGVALMEQTRTRGDAPDPPGRHRALRDSDVPACTPTNGGAP